MIRKVVLTTLPYAIVGFIFSFTSYSVCLGQTLFQNTYSTVTAGDALQTDDGGFILVGSSSNGLFIAKTDVMGNYLWYRIIFEGNSADVAYSIDKTLDGGYVIAGYINDQDIGSGDCFLIKMKSTGDVQWMRNYGDIMLDHCRDVRATSDGGYTMIGFSQLNTPGFVDVYIIKVDNLGNLIWDKTIGGSQTDHGYSFVETKDQGYIIAGYSLSYGQGSYDVYLIKIDSNNNVSWSNTYGLPGAEQGKSIIQSSEGGYYVCGYTNSFGAGDHDILLIKLDSLGNEIWSKAYGGSSEDKSYDLVLAANGDIIIAGSTESTSSGNSDICLLRVASDGTQIWAKGFDLGGIEEAFTIGFAIDSGIYVSGRSSAGMFLIKGDKNGFSGCSEIQFSSVQTTDFLLTSNGGDIDTGGLDSLNSADNGTSFTSEQTLCSSCDTTIPFDFVADDMLGVNFYDSTGLGTAWYWDFGDSTLDFTQNPSHVYSTPGKYEVCLWVTKTCGYYSICDSVEAFCLVEAGFSYTDSLLTVHFTDSSISLTDWFWDLGDGYTTTIPSPFHSYALPGTYNVCLMVSSSCGADTLCDSITVSATGISRTEGEKLFTVQPNPANAYVQLNFYKRLQDYRVEIFSIDGQLVQMIEKAKQNNTLNIGDLKAGMYIIKVWGEGEFIGSSKLIVSEAY